ncbi:uncharacterized protein LOC126551218 [Aphis gossypii]|uniref:uncharacterized protein LOC126551218 n=1 Tax=Aphis gossypii TaxID=80765 RepID=UPI002159319A|nr:uncharacterized protein LOC126551218 [Aphis gossypii]
MHESLMERNQSCIITIEDDYYLQKGKPQNNFKMKNTLLYVILICSLIYIVSTFKLQRRTMQEQKNIDDIKVILKDLRNVSTIIDNYEKNLNNSSVTTHEVNSMAAIKIAYDFIYSTSEKVFNKGATPSNSINGTKNHQNITSINGSQIFSNCNITIVNSTNKTT